LLCNSCGLSAVKINEELLLLLYSMEIDSCGLACSKVAKMY